LGLHLGKSYFHISLMCEFSHSLRQNPKFRADAEARKSPFAAPLIGRSTSAGGAVNGPPVF
jgi:hypothetical protein